MSDLQNKEKELLILEKEKSKNLLVFQKHVVTDYPFIVPLPHHESIEVSYKTKDPVDTKEIKKQIIDIIIAKAPNAY